MSLPASPPVEENGSANLQRFQTPSGSSQTSFRCSSVQPPRNTDKRAKKPLQSRFQQEGNSLDGGTQGTGGGAGRSLAFAHTATVKTARQAVTSPSERASAVCATPLQTPAPGEMPSRRSQRAAMGAGAFSAVDLEILRCACARSTNSWHARDSSRRRECRGGWASAEAAAVDLLPCRIPESAARSQQAQPGHVCQQAIDVPAASGAAFSCVWHARRCFEVVQNQERRRALRAARPDPGGQRPSEGEAARGRRGGYRARREGVPTMPEAQAEPDAPSKAGFEVSAPTLMARRVLPAPPGPREGE